MTQLAEALCRLKQAIATALMLAFPYFVKLFILETNISGSGVGAMLSQDNYPFAYFSKKLSNQMKKQSANTRWLHLSARVHLFLHSLCVD